MASLLTDESPTLPTCIASKTNKSPGLDRPACGAKAKAAPQPAEGKLCPLPSWARPRSVEKPFAQPVHAAGEGGQRHGPGKERADPARERGGLRAADGGDDQLLAKARLAAAGIDGGAHGFVLDDDIQPGE